jgi:hypothetical protein
MILELRVNTESFFVLVQYSSVWHSSIQLVNNGSSYEKVDVKLKRKFAPVLNKVPRHKAESIS